MLINGVSKSEEPSQLFWFFFFFSDIPRKCLMIVPSVANKEIFQVEVHAAGELAAEALCSPSARG